MNILRKEVATSSSFAAATPRWKHDVFLSFRGEDTRKNFTDHLYTALKQKGINTFRDDEKLERGKSISPELLKAIEESRFAIIVLSRNYANSTWCLDELAQIVKCIEIGLTVLPVFYDVDPSEVRNQTGTFAKAFAKHERRFMENNSFFGKKRFKRNIENVETWRDALREVANISGWHLGERNESTFIQDIVKRILKKLHDTFPRVIDGLVGIKHQVEELKRLLCVGSKDVRVIGISGMGGIGKTTLAKVVCSIFSNEFESCIFIEVSKESDPVRLQQQLLHQILNEKDIYIWNVERGVNMIKDMLHDKNNLLVLDDVNHLDQLKYLAGQRNWFGSGSRIIITTRDEHLLIAHRVDAIHKCKKLNSVDALELLCSKAFEKKQPEKGYEEISQEIVDYTNGLPIALDVLGSRLVGKPINHWKDVLRRLKEYPEADILKTLEISYDGLNNEAEKRIFIYIACFLKGINQVLVTDILESFNLYPTSGINVLIDRSLITISENNIVQVHDLLQEMGWQILRKQSPAELGNRRGLKFRKDILDVLTNNEGTKAIEIINQELCMKEVEELENCTCNPKAFSEMRKLGFLRIRNVYFPQGIEYLSNELRILEWHGYPSESLPSGFKSKEIRELDMCYSQIKKLWEGAMLFPNLRSIDLSCSENLTQPPDLTGTPRLEALDLHGCTNLVEGHPSIAVHKKLNFLNLAGCISLENLPSKIEMESLETLILSDCSKVRRIPEFGENMKRLLKLYLDGTGIDEIPLSIRHLIGVQYIVLSRCSKLGKPPKKLGEIVCLENLDASKTATTEMHSSIVPTNLFQSLDHLCCLTYLDLRWCNLFEIPNAIDSLSSLEFLFLDGNNFGKLPASINKLSNLGWLMTHQDMGFESSLDIPTERTTVALISNYYGTSLRTSPHFLQKWKCDSLGYFVRMFSHSGCPKLIENDSSVVILNRHLRGPYGEKVPFFTTNFAKKIPQWFTHQRVGNYVIVKLPLNWRDDTWMGFALCATFSLSSKTNNFGSVKVSVFVTTFLPDCRIYDCHKTKHRICPHVELALFDLCKQAVWYVPKDTLKILDPRPLDFSRLLKIIKIRRDIDSSRHFLFYFQALGSEVEMNCGVRLVNKQDVVEMTQTTSQASRSSIPPSCFNCPKLIDNEKDKNQVVLEHHHQADPWDTCYLR